MTTTRSRRTRREAKSIERSKTAVVSVRGNTSLKKKIKKKALLPLWQRMTYWIMGFVLVASIVTMMAAIFKHYLSPKTKLHNREVKKPDKS